MLTASHSTIHSRAADFGAGARDLEATSCGSDPETMEVRAPSSTVLNAPALQDALRGSKARFDEAEAVFARRMRDEGLDYTPVSLTIKVTTDGGGLRSRSAELRTIGYGIVEAEGVGWRPRRTLGLDSVVHNRLPAIANELSLARGRPSKPMNPMNVGVRPDTADGRG